MAVEKHEQVFLLRSAARAARDAFDSLAFVTKCTDEAGSEYASDASLLRGWASRLGEDLSQELRSIEDAESNVRWL